MSSEAIEPVIKHDYAQIGGVRLHYAHAGFGEKMVVLLHGFPECWYSWRHQLLNLAKDYTVVAPDMRGYNLSDKPPSIEDYAIDKLVDDVTGLIRHLGRPKAAIVGHDWGGGVAWATALKHPEYVWKLASLQTPPLPVWRKNITLKQVCASWYMFFFQIPFLPEWIIKRNNFALLERAFKTSTALQGVITDTDIAVYKKALSEPGALTAALNYYRSNVRTLFLSKKNDAVQKRITVPTLFIYGEKDQAILPSTVKGVKEFVDGHYKEVRIAYSAHWVQQEAKEDVTKALANFLAE